jgi:hypothetical protein
VVLIDDVPLFSQQTSMEVGDFRHPKITDGAPSRNRVNRCLKKVAELTLVYGRYPELDNYRIHGVNLNQQT